MARGKSGRIVLEVDPTLKKNLYLALEKDQMTLKEWFIKSAEDFIINHQQLKLFVSEQKSNYKKREEK